MQLHLVPLSILLIKKKKEGREGALSGDKEERVSRRPFLTGIYNVAQIQLNP